MDVAPEPPIDDWDLLREAMRRSSWSPQAREAGGWALQVLERRIGSTWPHRWRDSDDGPPEVLYAHTHLIALAATLDLALALELVHAAPGAAQVRRQVRGAAGPVALAHSRLLLRVGALAVRAGLDVAFEPRRDGGPPADVRLSGEDASVTVEARVLLRDDVTLAAQRWFDENSLAMHAIAAGHDVDLDGTLDAPLDRGDTRRLLAALDRAAASVAEDRTTTGAVQVATAAVRVMAAGPSGPRQRWRMPPVQLWRRADGKLRGKVEQSRRSGADWLLVQVTDDLLRLTSAATLPPAERAALLAGQVRASLDGAAHLHGVVIDDGAVLVRPVGDELTESVADGAVLRVRRLDAIRLRETVTVALTAQEGGGAGLWARVWDAEPGWTAWATERCGVPTPPELSP